MCVQEAVDIVQTALTSKDGEDEPDCDDACQTLIQEAATRWRREEGDYRDDVRPFAHAFAPSLPLRVDADFLLQQSSLCTWMTDHRHRRQVPSPRRGSCGVIVCVCVRSGSIPSALERGTW